MRFGIEVLVECNPHKWNGKGKTLKTGALACPCRVSVLGSGDNLHLLTLRNLASLVRKGFTSLPRGGQDLALYKCVELQLFFCFELKFVGLILDSDAAVGTERSCVYFYPVSPSVPFYHTSAVSHQVIDIDIIH